MRVSNLEDFSVHVSTPAKVNLALRVGPPRADGFHPLATLFEALDIFDEVYARLPEAGEAITCDIEGIGADFLPTDSANLAVRAAELLRTHYGVSHGAHLKIVKRIPVAGGMAGGSADAAGALLACAKLWGVQASKEELASLAAQLGSDVPFALMGSLAYGRGRGEKLQMVAPGAMHCWVILTNSHGLRTPDVFREFDSIMGYERPQMDPFVPSDSPEGDSPEEEGMTPDISELLSAVQKPDIYALAPLMINDLHEPAFSLRPELRTLVKMAKQEGVGAIVSGSGPSIAVLCEDFHHADVVAGRLRGMLREDFPTWQVMRANGPAVGAHLR